MELNKYEEMRLEKASTVLRNKEDGSWRVMQLPLGLGCGHSSQVKAYAGWTCLQLCAACLVPS